MIKVLQTILAHSVCVISEKHRDRNFSRRSVMAHDQDSADNLSRQDVGSAKLVQSPVTSPKQTTLRDQEVDFEFREPFILTGYRLPNQTWRYYFCSFFWLHNESFNVWTHAIGFLAVLAHGLILGQKLDNFGDSRISPVIGFTLGCLLINLVSSLAHLLHSKSPRHHYILYMIDYAGITFYNFGNGIVSMYICSHPHQFLQLNSFFLPVLLVFSWLSFLASILGRLHFKGHFRLEPKLIMIFAFATIAGIASYPMWGRYIECLKDETCSLRSLDHITVVFVFFALDGLCYAAHFPERCWPGTFDIWGHGHQWFHVCVLVTQQLQLLALDIELVELKRGHHATTTLSSILLAFLLLATAEALTLKYFLPSVQRKTSLHINGHEKTQ